MRFISRLRTVLANLRGFKLTLTVDPTELRPDEPTGAKVQFTFHDRALPEAMIHLFQNEVEVASGRTLLDGTWGHTLSFTKPGVYDLIARYQTLALTVESNLVTVLVGYLLTIQAAEGGTTDPVAGTYRITANEASVEATPDPGYTFVWNLDGETVSVNPITVDMRTRDHKLQPFFKKLPYTHTWRGYPIRVGERFGSDPAETSYYVCVARDTPQRQPWVEWRIGAAAHPTPPAKAGDLIDTWPILSVAQMNVQSPAGTRGGRTDYRIAVEDAWGVSVGSVWTTNQGSAEYKMSHAAPAWEYL